LLFVDVVVGFLCFFLFVCVVGGGVFGCGGCVLVFFFFVFWCVFCGFGCVWWVVGGCVCLCGGGGGGCGLLKDHGLIVTDCPPTPHPPPPPLTQTGSCCVWPFFSLSISTLLWPLPTGGPGCGGSSSSSLPPPSPSESPLSR